MSGPESEGGFVIGPYKEPHELGSAMLKELTPKQCSRALGRLIIIEARIEVIEAQLLHVVDGYERDLARHEIGKISDEYRALMAKVGHSSLFGPH